jgi:lysyl-tRNA synthetase class II
MEELNEQQQQRIKKLDSLRDAGVAPYGTRFEVKDRAGQLIALHGEKSRSPAPWLDASSPYGDSGRQASRYSKTDPPGFRFISRKIIYRSRAIASPSCLTWAIGSV